MTTADVTAAPREAPVPAARLVRDPTALRAARASLHYAEAVRFWVDEPPEGGKVATAALLLATAAQQLDAAHAPMPAGQAGAFWSERCAEAGVSAEAWAALFHPEGRAALSPAALAPLRSVVWAGFAQLEAPEAARQRARLLRAAKGFALVLAVAGLGGGAALWASRALKSPSLLVGKPLRTSSTLNRDTGSSRLLFHTESDASPWVEYDLGAPTALREVTVENRSDCCDERAIPLLVEVSDDQLTWKSVASRNEPFSRVVLGFNPVTARYLRLRVNKPGYMHLEGVEAR